MQKPKRCSVGISRERKKEKFQEITKEELLENFTTKFTKESQKKKTPAGFSDDTSYKNYEQIQEFLVELLRDFSSKLLKKFKKKYVNELYKQSSEKFYKKSMRNFKEKNSFKSFARDNQSELYKIT